MIDRSSDAAVRLTSSIAAGRFAMFTQLRVPLLNSETCQPLVSRAKRKSTRTRAVTSADDSDPRLSPYGSISLILTSSEGRATPNRLATKQRARFVISAVANVLRPNRDGVLHSPSGT